MNTNEIMQIALTMAGFDSVPGDSAIYNKGENLKKALIGIDISTAELKMAKDMGYDVVIAHHPPMLAALHAHRVYARHAALMIKAGVPEEKAWAAVQPRMDALASRYQSANHDHFPSIARLLDMPFMNIHGPLDELGRAVLQERVDRVLAENDEATLADVVTGLNEIEEFAESFTEIEIAVGQANNPAGKVVVAHGALTNGGYDVANTYFENGVGTVIYIHCNHQDIQRLRKEAKGNLIITGHIVSDVIGINPFIKKLQEQGMEVVGISGLK